MSNKVTFHEIVEELASQSGLSESASHDFISSLVELVSREAIDNGKAAITNFGSFSLVNVAARTGVNPRTGEPIAIPAHQRLAFTPYKALENKVNAPFAHLEAEVIDDADTDSDEEDTPPSNPLFTPSAIPDETPEKEELEDDPFAFLEDDEEEERPPSFELDEEDEPEPEEDVVTPPVYTRPGKKESQGNSPFTYIILAVIVVLVVFLAWFFIGRGGSEPEVATQLPLTPEESVPVAPEETPSTPTVEETAPAPEPESTPAEAAPAEPENSSYTVAKGVWFYEIARQTYGRAVLWPLIFEANYSVDTDPDSIQPGPQLIVPGLEGTPTNLSSADKEKLAAAALVVAEAYTKAGKTDKADQYTRYAKKVSGE